MKSVAILAMLALPVLAEDIGGYRLISREGNTSTNPAKIVAIIPLKDAAQLKPGKTHALSAVLPQIVTKAEALIRRSPTGNATNSQREEGLQRNTAEMGKLIDDLPGTAAAATLMVVDVINRPGDELGRRMLVGRVNWQSPAAIAPANQRKITEIKREKAQMLAEMEKEHRAKRREFGGNAKALEDGFRVDRKQIEDSFDEKLKEVTAEAVGERPVHLVYVVGNDPRFGSLRRGQVATVKGVIQQVGLFVYNAKVKGEGGGEDTRVEASLAAEEDLSIAYVGFEMVIWSTPD